MKIGIIISTNEPESCWNALRFANFSLNNKDEVNIFLIGKGVEYEQISDEKFRSEERRVGKECRSRWSPYH